MESETKTQVVKDLNRKTLVVTREFNAPLKDVWRAFTEPAILDQWWGPLPWKARTKYMDFSPGGYWLYSMVGPDHQLHWARMNYLGIDYLKGYDVEDCFCNEEGVVNKELPISKGKTQFNKATQGTRVEFSVTYPTEADLNKIVEMGMVEGITICYEQLDGLFAGKKI